MKGRSARASALAAAAAAVALQAGCSGILGLSAGTSSDGGLGSPCVLDSDTPTPCAGSGMACVLNVCRASCTADSDCLADQRCLEGTASSNNGGSTNGFGCVPLTATSCTSDGCAQPDVCDSSGQCRTPCDPNDGCTTCTLGCAGDQTCQSMGGVFACYGPHDKGYEAPDGAASGSSSGSSSSGSGSGGGDATTVEAGVTCTGTPDYASCAACQSTDCTCPGCSTTETNGTCTGVPYSCTECGSLYACSPGECPDCTPGGACTGSPNYTSCAACPVSDCANSSLCPGCTLSGFDGPCVGTITPCSANATQATCEGESSCTWTTGACSGVPRTCSAFATQGACSGQAGCGWSSGFSTVCSGTVTPCADLPVSMCASQPGCSTTSEEADAAEDGPDCGAGLESEDGSTACNCLSVSGNPIDVIAESSLPTSPTGGVVRSGTYELTSVTFYSVGGGSPTPGTVVGNGQSTIVLAGSSWQQVIAIDGGAPATDTGTFTTSGPMFTVSRTCPDTSVAIWEYRVAGDQLTLFVPYTGDGGPSGELAETFTLQ